MLLFVSEGVQMSAAELEMKLNAARYDPRYLMSSK